MPVRCSSCLLPSLWGKPRSPDALVQPLWAQCPQPIPRTAHFLVAGGRCGAPGAPSRSVPTQSVVQGFIEITNSSSSSHVWNLGTTPLRAAQRANAPVGRLWVVSVFLLSTRGHLDGCAPTSGAVHPLSPASPGGVPRFRREWGRRHSGLQGGNGRTHHPCRSASRNGSGVSSAAAPAGRSDDRM